MTVSVLSVPALMNRRVSLPGRLLIPWGIGIPSTLFNEWERWMPRGIGKAKYPGFFNNLR
jgi:hypothetical protein